MTRQDVGLIPALRGVRSRVRTVGKGASVVPQQQVVFQSVPGRLRFIQFQTQVLGLNVHLEMTRARQLDHPPNHVLRAKLTIHPGDAVVEEGRGRGHPPRISVSLLRRKRDSRSPRKCLPGWRTASVSFQQTALPSTRRALSSPVPYQPPVVQRKKFSSARLSIHQPLKCPW